MKVNGKNYTSIWIEEENRVFIIDQRWLPHEFKTVELKTISDFAISIKDMWVRGAPLIGVTAAFGFAKSMQHDNSDKSLEKIKAILLSTRPTAVNLHWAVEIMYKLLISAEQETRFEIALNKATTPRVAIRFNCLSLSLLVISGIISCLPFSVKR